KIRFLLECAIEYALMEISVFRMCLPNDLRKLGWNRPLKCVNPIGFRRPVNLTGYGVPAETAGVAGGLGLIQVGLAAPQGLFGAPALAVFLLQVRIEVGILERARSLGGNQPQHRASGRREYAGGQVI